MNDKLPWFIPGKVFADGSAIADEVFHMAHQDHTAWVFETTIRPFAEKW